MMVYCTRIAWVLVCWRMC